VFKPYAGVSTAILVFTKTNSGGTDHVWFYDVDADGMSLDDKRTELLPLEKLGPVPRIALTADDHAKNNLPDILARWRSFGVSLFGVPASAGKPSELQHASKSSKLASSSHTPPAKAGTPNPELARPRTAQSFCVPKADLAAQGYDLSLMGSIQAERNGVSSGSPRIRGHWAGVEHRVMSKNSNEGNPLLF
jgi:type I restriction enzyme M protein